jgi:hypothetical protein
MLTEILQFAGLGSVEDLKGKQTDLAQLLPCDFILKSTEWIGEKE